MTISKIIREFNALCKKYPLDTKVVVIYDRFAADRSKPRITITLKDIKDDFDRKDGALYKHYSISSDFRELVKQIERGKVITQTQTFPDTEEAFMVAYKKKHGKSYQEHLAEMFKTYKHIASKRGIGYSFDTYDV